jgi:OOP family OmpA-OmpF porin
MKRAAMTLSIALATFTVLLGGAAFNQVQTDAVIPKADVKGSKDNPLVKRYEGSFILSYEHKSFTDFTLPLSKLEEVRDKRDSQNNHYFEPKKQKVLQSEYTRIVYFIPADRSPLEVLRNYQDEIKSKNGTILFECQDAACGGDPGRSSGGGGGLMSLAMYLRPANRITDPLCSNAHCAQTRHITEQRYFAAEVPASGAHVSVLAYTLKADLCCKAFNGRTIAIVDIVEARSRESKMVTVAAAEMENAITATGRVALYGIYFDFNKADVKPESDPTLEQIGKLMKTTPALKLLVVGHTDAVGSFSSNMDLSQRRAVAVVQALVSRFGIAQSRLTAVGVSFASPVASNKTDEGRAKNRRVELVENPQSTSR